jgi:hypothetical protein
MRTKTVGFSIAALCAFVAFGQTPAAQTQVFTFKHADTVQDFQEVCNLIRTATSIRDASTDNAQRTLTLKGTADQLALAGWLYRELDTPPQSQDPSVREYRAGADDIIHLYYVANAATVQEFQEIANGVRTASQIRTAFTYNAPRAMAFRGQGDQIALADWLVSQLDQPAQQIQPSAPHQYQMPSGNGDVVRIFYLPNTKTVQDFQEVANLIRTTTNIRMAFTYNAERALTLRGTGDEIALADWLVGELAKPTGGQAEYRVPRASDDVVKVFYVPHAATVQDFQQIASAVRIATNIRQAFTYNAERALALRGTVTQLALAERLVKDLDQPR